MKEQLEALLANLKRNYDMACEAQRYAGEDYYHVQSIVVGLREDIAALTAIEVTMTYQNEAEALRFIVQSMQECREVGDVETAHSEADGLLIITLQTLAQYHPDIQDALMAIIKHWSNVEKRYA